MSATNYARIAAQVADQAIACGRNPREVRLIAVSKTVEVPAAQSAFSEGACDFGENRPECLELKADAIPQANWHFIGNIQSRRIPQIVRSASLIHSLFEPSHARKIDEAACKLGKIQDVLIEVNVSGELSKGGCAPADAEALVHACTQLPHVRVRGLMTMAPQGDLTCARECFEQLACLEDTIRATLSSDYACVFTELSMGMSEDWPEAVAAGSTMVRIGRAIFSEAFASANR